MVTTQALISRLRELDKAAAPSPWRAAKWGDGSSPEGFCNVVCDDFEVTLAEGIPEPDATLIAEMRTALPVLLDRVDELQNDLERRHKDAVDRWERIEQLERALNFVTRFAWTKPELTASEALGAIAHHPDVKEIIERWQLREPEGERHWKLRDFSGAQS